MPHAEASCHPPQSPCSSAAPALAAPGDTPAPRPPPSRPARARGIMRYDTNKDGVGRPRRMEGRPGGALQAARRQQRRQAQRRTSCSRRTPASATACCRPTDRSSASRPISSASTPTRTARSAGGVHGPGRPQFRALRHEQGRHASTPRECRQALQRARPSHERDRSASRASRSRGQTKRPPDVRRPSIALAAIRCSRRDMTSPNSSQVSPLKRCELDRLDRIEVGRAGVDGDARQQQRHARASGGWPPAS